MSDFINVDTNMHSDRSNAISWFNAISSSCGPRDVRSAIHSAPSIVAIPAREGPQDYTPDNVGPQQNDLSTSTICYIDESSGSLVKRMNTTAAPSHMAVDEEDADAKQQKRVENLEPTPCSRRRCKDMYEEAVRGKLAKRQWAAAEQLRQSILEKARIERDCTFRPQLSSYAKTLQRPAHLAPENRIYEELMRKSEWLAQKQREHIVDELKGCTFRPLTVRAAKLKSSAHVHDSHAFSELHNHHEEQKYFWDELRPRVVQHLEKKVLYKNPSNKVVSESKMNEVVERLVARSAVVQTNRRRARSSDFRMQTFKPIVNGESERIVSKRQDAGVLPEDVLERLTKPLRTMVEDRYQRREREERLLEEDLKEIRAERQKDVRAILQRELQKSFISAKFDALVDFIHREEPDYKGVDRRATKYPLKHLLKAAVSVLSPAEGDELVHILTHSRFPSLSRETFMNLCLRALGVIGNPKSSALASLPPPRVLGADGKRTDDDENKRGRSVQLRRSLSPEEVEAIAARRAERQRLRREEEFRRHQAAEEEEMKECTFQPQTVRKIPNGCRPGRYTDVRTTKGEILRRAHIQKSITGSADDLSLDLPVPSAGNLFRTLKISSRLPSKQLRAYSVCGHPGSGGKFRHLRTTAALKSCKQLSKSFSKAEGDNKNTSRRTASAAVGRGPSAAKSRSAEGAAVAAALSDTSSEGAAATCTERSLDDIPWLQTGALFRDVTSEHAALGGDPALTELGRQLILQQLREYRRRKK